MDLRIYTIDELKEIRTIQSITIILSKDTTRSSKCSDKIKFCR